MAQLNFYTTLLIKIYYNEILFYKKKFIFFIILIWYNVTEIHGGGVPGFASIPYNTGKTWYLQHYFHKPIVNWSL